MKKMDYETYIARKKVCFQGECGPVNIPFGTELTAKDGTIYDTDGRPLCSSDSKQALDVFCQNDDGQGLERGALVEAIKTRLAEGEGWMRRNKLLDVIWVDDLCQTYRRFDVPPWVWKPDFYNAPLKDLCHIANLIGVKIETV